MPLRGFLLFSLLVTTSVGIAQAEPPATDGAEAAAKVNFNRDIRPLLSNTCFTCHGPDEGSREADLRLDTHAGALEDRGGSRAVVPFKPEDSDLIARITSEDPDERMPPPDQNRQLSSDQKEMLRRWIKQGAPWARHWSFEPPVRPELPKVKQADWPANGIDHFVLKKLESESLKPSPPAARNKLLRRVTLDLTGLPPTVAELDAFLNDKKPGAYERAVDRLLKSPRFGEHLAAPWLDAARYADSNGYQGERTRTMWPWRDWVINALNSNMPFDQFTIEQLAGDLLPGATLSQQVATGFNRNHMLNGEGGRIAEESRVEYVVDRVETTSTTWLGLTTGCARCHDHKFDPISQKDFYRFYAYFNSIDERGNVDRGGNANPVVKVPTPAQSKQREELQAALAQAETSLREATSSDALNAWLNDGAKLPEGAKPDDKIQQAIATPQDKRTKEQSAALKQYFTKGRPAAKKLQQAVDNARKKRDAFEKSIVETMVMRRRSTPRQTFRLERGLWDKPDKSEELQPASLPAIESVTAGQSRLDLARWLTNPKHPLTARVTVNRFWQHFFGQGLVKTTEDFGTQGERPSHPQLLDWLATTFIQNGWDVKQLLKLIVTSQTYQQSSKVTPELLARDPSNRLLGRGPRFRMSSLMLRDQALAISGLLVEKVGGPPVMPYQPPGVWSDLTLGKISYKQDHGDKLYRRSIYTFWRRSVGPTMLFDTSARQVCTVRIARTNTPLHALTLLNETTYVESARKFAEQIMQKETSPAARLKLAFRRATARLPDEAELKAMQQVLDRLKQRFRKEPENATKLLEHGESPVNDKLDTQELAAYTGVMSMILNLDETITKE